jgi:hypothetical protein
MALEMSPDSVLGCEANSHRHGWNGTICRAASTWSCSRKPNLDFRTDYCESGDPRCFHMHTFNASDPHFVIESNGAGWILEDDRNALDDQILLLWGQPFAEPRGIREIDHTAVVFGAYRIRSVEPRPRGVHTNWVVRPYADGWTRFAALRIPAPRYERLRGRYLQQVARSSFERVLQLVDEADASDPTRALSTEDKKRFDGFRAQASGWLDQAVKSVRRVSMSMPGSAVAPMVRPAFTSTPFRDIGKRIQPVAPAGPSTNDALRTGSAAGEDTGTIGIVDSAQAARIESLYGPDTLTALRVASLTKPLIILRGNPGVGKSTLAGSLIDDPKRDRTLIVAVTSTWRGREDLLGYVNPISGEFEPTEFTRFLLRAEQAWNENRQQPHVVVFEEFNLSQPEYWLSDVLVRSQLADKDRTIHLGGIGIRDWKPRVNSVFLSPAIRFVATINADHTGRPISPRVLDRAAVVDIALEPRQALAALGVELDTDQLSALDEIDFLLRDKGATFSLRTAKSLKQCHEKRAMLALDTWGTLDLVLLQELFSKVRLLAVDPTDQQLVAKLVEWSDGAGEKLVQCSREIESWRDLLQANRDVQKV